jgi:hypothetical protein
MDDEKKFYRTIIRVGIILALPAGVIYPLMIFVPLPRIVTVILACLFGPLLGVGSLVLYYFLKIYQKTVSGLLAVISNIAAAIVVNLMLIVQLSVNLSMDELMNSAGGAISEQTMRWVWRVVDRVQLGMDVSWDFFIATGTILFGIAMMKHPRFGKIFGILGMFVGLLLLGFNLSTFPVPPGNAGLIDLGPALGLWYLAVTIQVIRSLKWFDGQLV